MPRHTIADSLATTPMAAIAVSVAAGILIGNYLPGAMPIGLVAIAAALASLIALRIRSSAAGGIAKRNIYWLPISLLFTACGLISQALAAPPSQLPGLPYFVAQVSDITTKTYGDEIRAKLLYFTAPPSPQAPASAAAEPVALTSAMPVIIRTQACSAAPGDIILLRNDLEPIEQSPVNEEFDYPRYMASQGIRYSQWTDSCGLRIVGHNPSLLNIASRLRSSASIYLDHTPLSRRSISLLQTLLLGERTALDPTLRTDFAALGIAHIFALSGMHLGIVVLILSCLLYPLRIVVNRKLRYLIIIAGLWAFTFITGMQTSLVRSAIMATSCLLALALERQNSALNALFAAAAIILLCSPESIFNAGFQLSFTTTTALIVFAAPPASSSPASASSSEPAKSRHTRLRQVLAVPLIAFASSWVLSLYYFHTLAPLSIPANILASLLITIIFYLSAAYFPLLLLGFHPTLLGSLIDRLTLLTTTASTRAASALPPIQDIWVPALLPLLYLLSLALLAYWYTTRERHTLTAASAMLVLTAIAATLLPTGRPADGIALANINGKTYLTTYTDGRATHLDLPGDTIALRLLQGRSLVVADRYLDPSTPPPRRPMHCDMLLVQKRSLSSIPTLLSHFRPRALILSEAPEIPTDTLAASEPQIHIHDLARAPLRIYTKQQQ